MKQVLPLILAILLSGALSAQTKKAANTPTVSWAKNVPTEEVIKWRRHIHQNPELSFQEENTSKYVEEILKSMGNI